MQPLTWVSRNIQSIFHLKKPKKDKTYDIFQKKQKEIDLEYERNLNQYKAEKFLRTSFTEESSF